MKHTAERILIVATLSLSLTHCVTGEEKKTVKDTAPPQGEKKVEADIKIIEAEPEPAEGKAFAEAKLDPKSGSKAGGTVQFVKRNGGVELVAKVDGVAPGSHGIHIHEKGDCSAADAASAGGHYNPGSAPHAGPKDAARHAGDFGNIEIDKSGTGRLALAVGAPQKFNDWNSIVGKAVVLHGAPDDLTSQPSGNAGPRVACGVIKALAH